MTNESTSFLPAQLHGKRIQHSLTVCRPFHPSMHQFPSQAQVVAKSITMYETNIPNTLTVLPMNSGLSSPYKKGVLISKSKWEVKERKQYNNNRWNHPLKSIPVVPIEVVLHQGWTEAYHAIQSFGGSSNRDEMSG